MTQITPGFMNTNMLTPDKLPNKGLPLHYTSKISFRDKVVGNRRGIYWRVDWYGLNMKPGIDSFRRSSLMIQCSHNCVTHGYHNL